MAEPTPTLREMTTSALRYWERRRIVLNGVLAFVVFCVWFRGWQVSEISLPFTTIFGLLIIFAVKVNIAFCGVYIVDIFVQSSDFRSAWLNNRWILFVAILVVASISTYALFQALLLVPSSHQFHFGQ